MVLDPAGPPCTGSWRGCLESYLSEGAIREALERCGYDGLQALEEEAGAHGSGNAAGATDGTRPSADAAWRLESVSRTCPDLVEAARAFAQAVHTLSNLLNPEAYLIVTRYRWLSEYLAGALDRYLESDSPGLSEGVAAILPEVYDPLLSCHGAVDLVLDHFFAREAG
jgi:predicted NBD/HSP70 family sugar kinase